MFSAWHGLLKLQDLARRTNSDKVLRDKAFANATNLKYGYQKALVSMVYKVFDKKSISKQYLSDELNKPVSHEKTSKAQSLFIFLG